MGSLEEAGPIVGSDKDSIDTHKVLGDIKNNVPHEIRRNKGSKPSGNGVSWLEVISARLVP